MKEKVAGEEIYSSRMQVGLESGPRNRDSGTIDCGPNQLPIQL